MLEMLEILLAFLCIGSSFNQNACNKAWDKENTERPELSAFEKDLQKRYYNDQPDVVKYTGALAAVFYKKEIRFTFYHGTYVDIKDEGRIIAGKVWTF